ncbi:MAG TPA: outer membrane beta-barrel protein [Burkholderiales bacterium]
MPLPSKLSLYLGLAIALACPPLLAEETLPWYVGGSFGASKFDFDGIAGKIDSDLVNGGTFPSSATSVTDDDDIGLKGYVGYQFSKYFGGEVGFFSPGQPTLRTQTPGELFVGSVDVSGWFAEFVATLPLGEKFSVHAKAGPFFWRVDSRLPSTTTSTSVVNKYDGIDLTAGVGLGYAINDQIGARLEIERFQFDDDTIDYISAGLLIRF